MILSADSPPHAQLAGRTEALHRGDAKRVIGRWAMILCLAVSPLAVTSFRGSETAAALEPPARLLASDAAPLVVTTGDHGKILGLPVVTAVPNADEPARPWVDSTGKHAVVATLLGLDGSAAKLRLASDREATVPLARLSDGDAAYARLRLAPRVNPAADVFIGKVVKITDGYTLQIRTIDHSTKMVRLNGIDAPESGQPFGTRSQELLGDPVFQKEVRAEVTEAHRYGWHIG